MTISENNPDKDFIEVPPPLQKYEGGEILHEDNEKIIRTDDSKSALLPRKAVKFYRQKLSGINQRLNEADIDYLLSAYDTELQHYNSLKLNHQTLIDALATLEQLYSENPEYRLITVISAIQISQTVKKYRHAGTQAKKQLIALRQRLEPHRRDIRHRQIIQQKLESHRAALEDKKQEQILQQQMAREAHMVEDQLITTLSRLGFRHTYTEDDKTKTDRVQFSEIIATADQLQFKIAASRRGMFGGAIDLLPQGVYVSDILTERVMNELSASLEREVWTPHASDEKIPVINGAWLIVERLGLVEGIPKEVNYRQLMARYETARHKDIPIPAGLKRGRRVNWIHLNDSSAIHFMFNGISGSGKSNAMRAMVSAIVEKQNPADVAFIFIDLKGLGDFAEFMKAPHTLAIDGKKIIETVSDVLNALQTVQAEMYRRKPIIKTIAKDLTSYNRRVQPENRLPKICVVFDEYAATRINPDLAKQIDQICIEIGQLGRAFGISLWIGTQQPRRENIANALRDNLATKFVGHQANVGAAQSATGNRDALRLEDFPGRFMCTTGLGKSFKIQMPFIPDDDVRLAVQIARDKYGEDPAYSLEHAESSADEFRPPTDEEIVLDTALNEFNGALKIYPIYKHLKAIGTGNLSRGKITKIVNELADQQVISYDEMEFSIENQPGNYFAMVLVDPDDE